MHLSTLSPGLLYALLSINPNADSIVARLSSTTTTTTTTSSIQDTNTITLPRTAASLSHRSLLSYRTYPDARLQTSSSGLPVIYANATVTCRNGNFQNMEMDIQEVVCDQYYKCGDSSDPEQHMSDGKMVWTATCYDCVAGQERQKASGCIFTEM